MRITECVACHSSMEWVQTTNGKPMPIDIGTHSDGNLIVVGHTDDDTKIVKVSTKKDNGLWEEPRYISHFATCKFAERFRKRHTVARHRP